MIVHASDASLLDAWQAGDIAAGRVLFERHFDAIHGFFRRRAPGHEQDLTQRTLLGCLEGRDRFRKQASFRTYLFRIARLQLLVHYRELQRQNRFTPLPDEAKSPLTSPSAVIARRQRHRHLLDAIDRLRPEHREMLTLGYWRDLTCAEIARLLGIPETTARSRMKAAGEQLRDLLPGESFDVSA